MKSKLFKFINTAKKAPGKKHHLDFIAALLTIPVLLSVIIINYSNLQNMQKGKIEATPTSTQAEKIIVVPEKNNSITSTPVVTIKDCIKDIGPINISTPQESSTINENPINFTIEYTDNNYCSVVWSYRINNGSWSSYTSNNPVVYNTPKGNVKFELKIQSTVIQKEKTLTRIFTYTGGDTPIASQSALNQ